MTTPNFYVEDVSKIEPDTRSGIVKLTFSAEIGGGETDQVTIIIPAGALNMVFQKVGQTMQKSFGSGPGGPGGPPGPGRQRGPGGKSFKDLTEN